MKKAATKLSEAALEARRAYRREWAHKNRDKLNAAQERYWEKKALAAEQTAPAAVE